MERDIGEEIPRRSVDQGLATSPICSHGFATVRIVDWLLAVGGLTRRVYSNVVAVRAFMIIRRDCHPFGLVIHPRVIRHNPMEPPAGFEPASCRLQDGLPSQLGDGGIKCLRVVRVSERRPQLLPKE